METPNKSAVICQAILLVLSLVFLYLTILSYDYYTGRSLKQLPNIPGGFAVASAISTLGIAIIEASKPPKPS